MEMIWRDVKVAVRGFWKTPVFAAVTVLTLAVGVGAVTAMYAVVEGVLLRDLPYSDADRIVRVAATTQPTMAGEGVAPFSDRGYWLVAENNRSFEEFGGFLRQVQSVPLTGDDAPIEVGAAVMTRTAFQVLGVQPLRGRLPAQEEDLPDAPRVILVSEGLWVRRYGSDPGLVGRSIEVNGTAREIVGIMPASFEFPEPGVDVWVPYGLDRASENFGAHHIEGLARLAPGATLGSATRDMESLVARFGEVGYDPAWFTGVFDGGARVWTLEEDMVGDARRPLWILFASVGFVLLIAGSNVANLLLVRAESRMRESAVRLALGSGRGRIVRQTLVESLLLALLGGVVGGALGWMSVRALVAAAPPSLPRLSEIGVGGTTLAFAAVVSAAVGLVLGLFPALRLGSPSALKSLRDGGRGPAGGQGRGRTRSALVTVQVALALVLLVASGLMVRTFVELRSVDPGFDGENLLTFGVRPLPTKYQGAEALAQFFDRLRERLAEIPGVEAVGGANMLPLTGPGPILATVIEDFPPAEGEFPPTFSVRRVTPGYFEVLGVPLVEGRSFTDDDHQLRLGSLVISENVKRRYWPETSAVGKRITVAGIPARVVGVVADVHHRGLDTDPDQFMYLPMLDSVGGGVGSLGMAVRGRGDPLALLPEVRAAVAELDSDLPMSRVRTMDSIVADSLSRTSLTMALLMLGALASLFLGAIGVYGVVSYSVSQRTAEIGVRMALGAEPTDVRSLVLRQGMRLTVAGLALGLAVAVFAGGALGSLLFGVSQHDPLTLAGGVTVFLVVSLSATMIPAARASRIAPSSAMRSG